MSLDQIGPLAKSVDDITLMLNIIKGKDENDTTTFDSKPFTLTKPKNIKVGVLKLEGINPKIKNLINEKIKQFSTSLDYQIVPIEIKHINLAVQTYYPLVYVEFFSSTRRYDGRKYGKKIEDVAGEEVLRRIFGGKEITKAEYKGRYYNKALQVKELIKEEFEKAFKKVDVIMLPTVPVLPWNLGETAKMSIEEIYASDALTTPANLAELPAISMPVSFIDGCPIGLQIMASRKEDEKLLSVAKQVELILK